MRPIQLVLPLLLSACAEPAASVSERPMDEVPVHQLLATGDREYRFANG